MAMIDRETIRNVMQPLAKARGLPNAFYVDREMLAIESETVFARNWCGIGFAKDVAKPGAVRPVTFLGRPLLMVRDRKGELRVFQNVCRHRGMILVAAPDNGRTMIRCPYHSWCYGLDGALVATPNVGGTGVSAHPDIKREELGLFEVRAEIWMDVVFVNLSGTAPAFRLHAAELIERCKEFDATALHAGGEDSVFSLELQTNWKLAVENYAEAYHLPSVHPGLNSYSKLEDHYHMIEASFAGQGSSVYEPGFGPNGERFAKFPGLSAKWDRGAEYPCFFPNVLFGFQNDHCYAILVEPISHDRTAEHVAIYYADRSMTEERFAAMRAKNAQMWKSIFVEDVTVVEGMQRGRSAPGFDGGKFSPVMDGPTHRFHAWVAEQITR